MKDCTVVVGGLLSSSTSWKHELYQEIPVAFQNSEFHRTSVVSLLMKLHGSCCFLRNALMSGSLRWVHLSRIKQPIRSTKLNRFSQSIAIHSYEQHLIFLIPIIVSITFYREGEWGKRARRTRSLSPCRNQSTASWTWGNNASYISVRVLPPGFVVRYFFQEKPLDGTVL